MLVKRVMKSKWKCILVALKKVRWLYNMKNAKGLLAHSFRWPSATCLCMPMGDIPSRYTFAWNCPTISGVTRWLVFFRLFRWHVSMSRGELFLPPPLGAGFSQWLIYVSLRRPHREGFLPPTFDSVTTFGNHSTTCASIPKAPCWKYIEFKHLRDFFSLIFWE